MDEYVCVYDEWLDSCIYGYAEWPTKRDPDTHKSNDQSLSKKTVCDKTQLLHKPSAKSRDYCINSLRRNEITPYTACEGAGVQQGETLGHCYHYRLFRYVRVAFPQPSMQSGHKSYAADTRKARNPGSRGFDHKDLSINRYGSGPPDVLRNSEHTTMRGSARHGTTEKNHSVVRNKLWQYIYIKTNMKRWQNEP